MGLAIIAKLARSAPISTNEPALSFEYGIVEDRPDPHDDGINSRTIRRAALERVRRSRQLTPSTDAE